MSSAPTAGAPPRLPDVRQALDWRELHDGLDEAQSRRLPILCLAEPHWSNAAQRLALVLGQDDAVHALASEAFVPVLVDPIERPDVAARLRWAAAALTGTAGPPLLALLTHRGAPFLAYCNLWPEGGGGYPSLRSLLRSVAEFGTERRAELEAEALRLQERSRGRGASAQRHTAWQEIGDDVDERFGGLREVPKHPRAPLLWRLLDEAGHPPVRAHLLRTLDGMCRGGLLDQLGGSFHRCSRDERWTVPHFEKLVPVNAALAAVYGRAAAVLDRPDLLETARGAASFAAAGLAEGAMALGADAEHYTWRPGAFQEALDPALLQALGLHFNITRDASPHVLYRALEPADMGDYAEERPETLEERIRLGRRRLALARMQRPPPARIAVDALSWRAESVRWLYEAARHGVEVDAAALAASLRALLDGPFDDGAGYARGPWHWLEDQVALAGACLAAGEEVDGAAERGRELAAIVLRRYCDGATGALADTPRGADRARPSQDVVDHALRAAVPATVDLLRALSSRGGDVRDAHGRAAERIERHHRDAMHAASGVRSVAAARVAERADARRSPGRDDARAAVPAQPA